MKIFNVSLLICIIILSCGTSISSKLSDKSFNKLDENTYVYVIKENETVPNNSKLIGEIKIGDSGFTTDCSYYKVLNDAKQTALNSGANIIKIIQLKKPTVLGSTCYRLKAQIYRNFDETSMLELKNKIDFLNKSRLSEGSEFAKIYFYRPNNSLGALLGYKIKDNKDSIIGRVRNGEKFEMKTTKYGNQTFYGYLETKDSVIVNIEKGKEYFIRCGVKLGVALGRPEIDLMENYIGREQYNEMK